MGDVFHTFPALTDAQKKLPSLVVDWVVEDAFQEIPKWHPLVDKVYPIELRKWRKHPWQYRQQIKAFFAQINQTKYDLILDAQGLLKSAWVVWKIKAPSAGMDWRSAREPLASWFYDIKISVDKNQHAIWRLRELFAKALNYPLPEASPIHYGLNTAAWQSLEHLSQPYAVFLHGTTWETKLWPEPNWVELGKKLIEQGLQLVLPWGNAEEQQRALRIAQNIETGLKNNQAWSNLEAKSTIWVPKNPLNLNDMASCLKFAQQVVSVDTGLSHVAAALDVPMVVLYRVTDPERVGAMGSQVRHLVSPLAKKYLKKFKNGEQSSLSLQNLTVADIEKVCSSLFKV